MSDRIWRLRLERTYGVPHKGSEGVVSDPKPAIEEEPITREPRTASEWMDGQHFSVGTALVIAILAVTGVLSFAVLQMIHLLRSPL